jgi:hypothetical protein
LKAPGGHPPVAQDRPKRKSQLVSLAGSFRRDNGR